MSDSSITLNLGTGGDLLDAELIGSLKRERMQIAGNILAEIARVKNTRQLQADYGLVTRPLFHEPITYLASYRLADATAGTTDLSVALAANTNKQLGTIHHAVGSAKTVEILQCGLIIISNSATAELEFEMRALSATTAPATGNPAITPGKHNQVSGAADSTCLALPTTAGSLVAANSPSSKCLATLQGITAGPTNPAGVDGQEIILFDKRLTDGKEGLIVRASTAEGYAINGRASAATTLRFKLYVLFTEV